MHLSVNHRLVAIHVGGADATTFMNGQFSNEVTALTAGQGVFGAFCTPKGRALALAHIGATGDGLVMIVERELAGDLLANLKRYVMRAKVLFSERPDWALSCVLGPAPRDPTDGLVLPLCHASDPSLWLLGASTADPLATDAPDTAGVALIRAGWPRVTVATRESFVPQMLNLDVLGGISFQKGCYTGQEIVARTQNLGTIKRRTLRYVCDGLHAIKPGQRLLNEEGTAIGTVVDAAHGKQRSHVLASIRLAQRGHALHIEADTNIALRERPLPYVLS